MFQHSHGAQQRLFDLWSCSGGAVQAVHFEYLKFTWSYTKRELIGGYWWYQSTWKISRTHEIAETCWNHQQNICWMQGRSCRNFAMQEFLIPNVVQGWTLPKVRNISAQINGLGKDLVDRYDQEWSIRIDLSATVSDLSWDQLCQSWAQPCQYQWKQNIISAVSSASTMVQHIQPNTWKQRRRFKKNANSAHHPTRFSLIPRASSIEPQFAHWDHSSAPRWVRARVAVAPPGLPAAAGGESAVVAARAGVPSSSSSIHVDRPPTSSSVGSEVWSKGCKTPNS